MADNDWKERLAQTVLLAGNGLSWGLGGKLIPGAQKNIAEARQELGGTGALTETAGQFAGGAALWKLGKAAIPYAGRGLMATVSAARAHPVIAGTAVALPIATSANYATGAYGQPDPVAVSAAPVRTANIKPMTRPAGKAAPKSVDAAASQIMSGLQSVDGQPPTFESMASQLAASQGGKISLNQLSSLGEIARSIATKPVKPVDPTITGAETLMQSYQERLQRGLADPDPQVQQRAMDDYEEKVLQLRKTRFIDPYGMNGDSGVE